MPVQNSRDVIDSRQVDAPLSKTLSIVASIRLPYRCDRIDKINPKCRYIWGLSLPCTTAASRKYTQKIMSDRSVQQPLPLVVMFYVVLRLSVVSTRKIMSGRPIPSPKQMAAILSYCAHRICSTFRTTTSETFAKRTVHHVRSIRDTNVSNVRVSNEQM